MRVPRLDGGGTWRSAERKKKKRESAIAGRTGVKETAQVGHGDNEANSGGRDVQSPSSATLRFPATKSESAGQLPAIEITRVSFCLRPTRARVTPACSLRNIFPTETRVSLAKLIAKGAKGCDIWRITEQHSGISPLTSFLATTLMRDLRFDITYQSTWPIILGEKF